VECESSNWGGFGWGSDAGMPTLHKIEWDVTLAIALGEAAKVSGCILALAGVTLGMECDVNEDKVDSASYQKSCMMR
jgi:hypothetical protein